MSFRHPFKKVRDLDRRFGEMERGVAELARVHEALQRQLEQLGDHQRGQWEDYREELRAGMEELRDSVHLVAARSALRRGKTRVLFLVHHIEAWDSLGELVAAMEATEDFEPIVASIPRYFHGMDGFGYEDEIHRQLTARGVAHIRLRDHQRGEALSMIKAIDPDLVFRQSQWDADVPDDLATQRLTFSRLCLVPYETMNLSMHDRQTVDSAYHRAAWAVFCANDLALELAEQVNARGGARFRVVGHPKADRLRRAVPRWPLERQGGRAAGRIVWSAHHSVAEGWSNFGMFHRVAEDMLSWAAADPDTDFVFMPHPLLLPFLHSADSPWPAARVDDWLARWRALPNTLLFTDGDYAPLLKAADVMVTDGISMLVEPQVVGLPIVWLEREDHRPFNEIGRLVRRGLHAVASVAEARLLARRFAAGEADPLAAVQAANVERLFGSASSVERTIRALREMIAEERPQPLASLASAPRERPGMPSRHGTEVVPPRSRRGSRDELPVIGRGDRAAAALAAPAVIDGREDSTYALDR